MKHGLWTTTLDYGLENLSAQFHLSGLPTRGDLTYYLGLLGKIEPEVSGLFLFFPDPELTVIKTCLDEMEGIKGTDVALRATGFPKQKSLKTCVVFFEGMNVLKF